MNYLIAFCLEDVTAKCADSLSLKAIKGKHLR